MGVWESALEDVGLNWFDKCYKDKRILITGHNGFKGSWLTLWLKMMGAEVFGISLEPKSNNHLDELNLNIQEIHQDIRDFPEVKKFIHESDPHFVFHMAAQPLVIDSYDDPINTWSTNVVGTVNILEICRGLENLKGIIVVTTDKCYENLSLSRGYKETDTLGGSDPYSASKAAAELVTSSYRRSYFKEDFCRLASARAGNVIGGGDWSKDRLIPDLIRAIINNDNLQVRSPKSTRPWQHVLDCLNGYLVLGQRIIENDFNVDDAFNFGPEISSNKTVEDVLSIFSKYWSKAVWENTSNNNLYKEAEILHLDSTKAKKILDWMPVWNLDESIEYTSTWYKSLIEKNEIISEQQIIKFMIHKKKLYET